MYVCRGDGDEKLTLQIVRPESMTPFGDTMRFINSNQADFSGVDHFNKTFVIEPFGGHIPESTLVSIPIG